MNKQAERGIRQDKRRLFLLGQVLLMMVIGLAFPALSMAATAGEIDRDVDLALQKLYRDSPAARNMSTIAKGVLVFPEIIKGGLIFGGHYGAGALRVGGKTTGYYRSVAASYGLQIGVESFGYALFFLDNDSLGYLNKSDGWEIGVGPSIVVVESGAAASLTTTTAKSGIYAFFFDQKGLMAGVTIQGSKVTRFTPGR